MKILLTILSYLIISGSLIGQKVEKIIDGNNIIHLTTYGSGDPILIINGGPGMNSEGFNDLGKILGRSNRTIIYDQRGTGQSIIPSIDSKSITIEAMVNDIEMIRNHLKIEKWVVLGHSFGGMLGSFYASKFPDRITGLILSSSGGINMDLFASLNILSRLTDLEKDSLNFWSNEIAKGDTTYITRLNRGKYLAPAYLFNKSNVPIVAHRLTQGNLRINQLVFQNMRAINFDCSEELKQLRAPVLIIQGRQDIIPESIAKTANDVLQNATTVILDNSGHYGWLDQPKLYFETIGEYLASLKKSKLSINQN